MCRSLSQRKVTQQGHPSFLGSCQHFLVQQSSPGEAADSQGTLELGLPPAIPWTLIPVSPFPPSAAGTSRGHVPHSGQRTAEVTPFSEGTPRKTTKSPTRREETQKSEVMAHCALSSDSNLQISGAVCPPALCQCSHHPWGNLSTGGKQSLSGF